jgi:hypothetical protein
MISDIPVTLADTKLTVSTADNSSLVGEDLYIDTSASTYAGITSSPSSGETTSGFLFLEAFLAYKPSGGVLQSSFYYEAFSDGSYGVKWISHSADSKGLVPVYLKPTPPGKLAVTGSS